MAAALAVVQLSAGVADAVEVAVVNQSGMPVYSSAVEFSAAVVAAQLKTPGGTPVEAVAVDGTVLPLYPGVKNGMPVIRVYLGLDGRERQDFSLRPAARWGAPGDIAAAAFDTGTQSGRLSNGLLTLDYRAGAWSLSFVRRAGTGDTTLVEDARMNYWLDTERRGRLMGMDAGKVAAMGLLHSSAAEISGGRASVNPDGSVSLTLDRQFGGMGADVVWQETYTLLCGAPVLVYKSRWTCAAGQERYLAFVGLGGGMEGNYGAVLRGGLRFKHENPGEGDALGGASAATTLANPATPHSRILLSGPNNSYTRIGWRGERCWVGIDSDLGCGLGFSTLKHITREIQGSSVWSFGNDGFFLRLLDDQADNMPYSFSREKPLESGFAFVATSAEVGIWNQTRNLFHAVTREAAPAVAGACSVHLGGHPVAYGESKRLEFGAGSAGLLVADGMRYTAAVAVDFNRPYRLLAKARGATPARPVTISVVAAGQPESVMAILTLTDAEEHSLDFTRATGWLGSRVAFRLDITGGPAGGVLDRLELAPADFPAPEPNVPADGLAMTDVATFFRWHQVKGALDYELQLARTPAFAAALTIPVRSEVRMPYYLPADGSLPSPGQWHWRLRAIEPGRPGQWSVARSFTVNDDLAKKPAVFEISPENPVFTMEGQGVSDWSRFKNTIPEDISDHVVFKTGIPAEVDPIAFLKPLHDQGRKVFLATHHPSPMSHWTPLSMVEEIFQKYPNVIGIQSGETLSTLYQGGDTPYAARLLKLCGKYGRIFYNADGTYPGENKWQALYAKEGCLLEEYRGHLIFAQKNNILHRQFVSQSSVLGLYLAGDILAQGAWEDGGWYWQQTGFRKLGEMLGQRGGDVTAMPRIFWTLNYVMGLGRGCSVFSFEGQVGTTPVPEGWTFAGHDDWPETAKGPYRNPAAFWTTDGELLPAFHRFCLPFMRAVVNHRLVPTGDAVRKNVRLAIYNDGIPKKEDGDPYYYEWEALYRGTYGFRDFGVLPGTLMEFFPNTGRYHFFPVLPQGRRDLGDGVTLLPLSRLPETDIVRAIFDAVYPQWYTGDALVTIVGDTLTVLNSNENRDETQVYSVPLPGRSAIANLAGKIGPHAYVIGKLGRRTLWLQANSEYPERDTELVLTCKTAPNLTVVPAAAVKLNRWDAAAGTLTLLLSHADGAVEAKIDLP